jgi:hypothetical protein
MVPSFLEPARATCKPFKYPSFPGFEENIYISRVNGSAKRVTVSVGSKPIFMTFLGVGASFFFLGGGELVFL